MRYIEFNKATGQLVVDFSGQRFAIEVPIENGVFISGEALDTYVKGFEPLVNTARIQALARAPSGAEAIEALCENVFQEYTPDYADLRRAAYPPATDYLDGLVKGDEEQMQAYIAQCREVKAMYPKVLVDDEVMRRRLQEAL